MYLTIDTFIDFSNKLDRMEWNLLDHAVEGMMMMTVYERFDEVD